MSVLVDTSVWIRFLSNRAPYALELDGLLSRDEVSDHDFVYGELLIGDKGGRKALLAEYERMGRAPVVAHADKDHMKHISTIGAVLPLALLAAALAAAQTPERINPPGLSKPTPGTYTHTSSEPQRSCSLLARLARPRTASWSDGA